MIADSMMPAGAAVADALGLPFVTLSAGTPINSEPDVPPSFVPWGVKDSFTGRLRNRGAYFARELFLRPALAVLNDFRETYNLPPYRYSEDSLSRLAQISPLIKELDFPRRRLPGCFHYVGRLAREDARSILFPYERLTGQPLIYFSCGTVSGMQSKALGALIRATKQLGAQLVVSCGKQGVHRIDDDVPSHVIKVAYAPQRTLLRKASASITHGGLNSTLESLMAGVPVIVIPKLRFDHPGVAARIAHHRAGKVLNRRDRCNPEVVRETLADFLQNPEWRERTRSFQKIIAQTGGAEHAAGIIETAARTRQPVQVMECRPGTAFVAFTQVPGRSEVNDGSVLSV